MPVVGEILGPRGEPAAVAVRLPSAGLASHPLVCGALTSVQRSFLGLWVAVNAETIAGQHAESKEP